MPANLTEAVVVLPTTETPAVAKTEAATETRTEATTPHVASTIREVDHDWKPQSMEDALAEGLGEIKRRPKPDDGTVETKTETKTETADDDYTPDEKALIANDKLPKSVRDSFQHQRQQLRDFKRRLKESEAKIGEAEALRTKIAELEAAPKVDATIQAKITELEAKAAKAEELAKLVEESESQLAVAAVERSREFRRAITEPLTQIEKDAAVIAKRNDIKESDIIAALRKPEEDRAEALKALTADMDDIDKTRLVRKFDDYAEIQARGEQIRSEARTYAERMEQEAIQRRQAEEAQANQRTAEQQAAWDKAVPERWESVIQKAGLAPIEGNDAWNRTLEQASAFAKTVPFHELTVEAQAEALHRAAIFPLMLGKVSALEQRVTAYQAKIAEYEKGTPGAGEGGRAGTGAKVGVRSKPASEGGLEAAIEEAFAEAGLA